jgi:hypothetical protein
MWAEIIASAVGAAIGAAATVGGGLWLARRARDEEERTSAKLLGDALVRFIEAINPFIVLTGEEIERRKTADVKVELQQAHEQFEHVAELVKHLLERDRGFSAKALLGIFGIIGVLRRERELWEAEQRVIAHPRATREVLRVHVEKLRASATKMDHHAEEALTSIGRKRPIVGRAAAMELDDVVVSSAAAS